MITFRKGLKHVLTIPLYTNAFYLMLNTAVPSLLGFFFWMVVARFYNEAVLGFSSAIVSAINLLGTLSLVGLNISLIRFMPHTDKPQGLINTCLTLSGVVSLVITGIFIAGLGFWSPALGFIKQNTIFCLAFLAFVLLWTLSSVVDYAFVAKRRAGFTLSKNTIFSLLKLPLPILFVPFFRTFGVVASWGIAMGVALALSLLLFMPKVQNPYKPLPTLKLGLLKGLWGYSGGNYLVNLLSAAPALILPLMVVNTLGAESNAHFYVAWMMAGLISAIPLAVSQSLFAEGSQFEDRLGENVRKSVKFSFLLLVPALILLVLLGKWLLLAFGQSYLADGLHLFWVLCLSSLPIGINYIYRSILLIANRIKELMIIWGFIAVAVLVISYLIMPVTGIIGIGYVWLGAQTLVAIYVLLVSKLGLHKGR